MAKVAEVVAEGVEEAEAEGAEVEGVDLLEVAEGAEAEEVGLLEVAVMEDTEAGLEDTEEGSEDTEVGMEGMGIAEEVPWEEAVTAVGGLDGGPIGRITMSTPPSVKQVTIVLEDYASTGTASSGSLHH